MKDGLPVWANFVYSNGRLVRKRIVLHEKYYFFPNIFVRFCQQFWIVFSWYRFPGNRWRRKLSKNFFSRFFDWKLFVFSITFPCLIGGDNSLLQIALKLGTDWTRGFQHALAFDLRPSNEESISQNFFHALIDMNSGKGSDEMPSVQLYVLVQCYATDCVEVFKGVKEMSLPGFCFSF